MEWNTIFLKKNILSVSVYTGMSSYFLYSLGKMTVRASYKHVIAV